MKSNNILLLFLLALMAGCGGGSGGGAASGNPPSGGSGAPPGGGTPPASTNNVLSITVNGSLCSSETSSSYPNKPCVSLTVCTPGTTACQTINDILLDTGSYGLRIFKSALNVSLVPVTNNSGATIAECVQYADGSSDWGPVQTASVILGNEPAVQVPIQVIDPAFGNAAQASCEHLDTSPAEAGFNGILGIGSFAQDCGSRCASDGNNGIYYACSGSNCSGTEVPLSSQVQNPVALLPQDNNGVIVQLPNIPAEGSLSANGYLVLGIGTQSNNSPVTGTMTYLINDNPDSQQYGDISTSFNGHTYDSFLDTGSNGLFFTSPASLPNCASPNQEWFCPQSTQDFSATNTGATGSSSDAVSFQIGNFDSFITSTYNVSSEIGANPGGEFDWGLPFFFGRNVYVGLEGKQSSLGTGPYYAY